MFYKEYENDFKLIRFVVGLIETNMYLVVIKGHPDGEGIVIDPGFSENEADSIIEKFKKEVEKIPFILLTHCHFDHIGGCAILKKEFNSKIYCHRLEKEKLQNSEKSGAVFFDFQNVSINVDECLNGGEEIRLSDLTLKVIHTPGHSKGGISILLEEKFLFSGDTIFKGSIGRTDFYDGSYEEEIASITQKILTLPDDTIIYPGHGPSTTVRGEKKYF